MSQDTVERVMNRLLSDEELRLRFAFDRIEVVADLHDGGLVLTSDEIDLFVQSDMDIWFGGGAALLALRSVAAWPPI